MSLAGFGLLAGVLLTLGVPADLGAGHTADPSSVTIAGSFQEELGCPGDWQPDCAVTHLGFDAEDDVWQETFTVPAGDWEYKAALNDSWTENYGAGAVRDGANIGLELAEDTAVKFYYSHETHWVTDNVNSIIAVAPGSFQSELGCAGDWDPGCLRSWLQDPDGDGVFTFTTAALAAGDYEAKVAIGESWDENYGEGGVPGGANIPFTVPSDCAAMLFSFDWATKILTVGPAPPAPQPASVTIPGSFQEELGCPGDWQPDCAVTHLGFDAEDAVWQETFDIPAGNWEYKAALNDSWDVNYGQNATQNGTNIPLSLTAPTAVKFYYSHETHWVTDNQGFVIATAPGSFQSELGCSGDWDPGCLRSWLQDPDGDGLLSFSARLPAGSYEVKVTIDESWDESYGEGGAPNGPNIPFTVPDSCSEVFFSYDPVTHLLTIGGAGIANQPPEALCQDVTVETGQIDCLADASIDDGSFDPDGDPITLTQSPPSPYSLGETLVTLHVDDDKGASDSCEGTVTVVDQAAPAIVCNNPPTITPPDAPISFTATAVDNCEVGTVSIVDYDCYWYNPAGKRVDKTDACVVSIAGATITIHDSGGVRDNIEWNVTATDVSGNSITMTCELQVVRPSR